ncbi:hypothetical protein LXL04_018672 [Taraxacum kok-saghyz]
MMSARTDIDRLSNLPEALRLHILGYLHAKLAVQTSVLSKTWVSLWTGIPVLKINYLDFGVDEVTTFDKFVTNVLCRRDSLAKLDRLKFVNGTKDKLNIGFKYAFLHGVKHLEAWIQKVHVDDSETTWPVYLCDTLRSLKLQCDDGQMRFRSLVSESILFKNLKVLYLTHALITEVDPFSGFPVLKSLTLIQCNFHNERESLKVHALQLTDLTILGFNFLTSQIHKCELTAPRLRFLKYVGPFFSIGHDQGLSVLETLDIGHYGFQVSRIMHEHEKERGKEKRLFDDMLSFFCRLRSVKSLTLSSIIIHILFLFPDELAKRCSPFWELEDLKFDLGNHTCSVNPSWLQSPSRESFEFVKAYLLKNSHDVKFRVTDPKSLEGKCMVSSICYEHRNL